ncbi:MAG TPA: nitroreductase family protein [Lentimicrobium sp.]|jgi:nitroreductase|nr:nitroreductase family protein [Lentimicrobium sp.]
MSIKSASNDYPLLTHLKERWSPRAFDNRFIEPAKIRSIFEAARWAPSGFNAQPWYFITGLKGDETYDQIASSMVDFNKLWATQAPLLFVAIAKETGPKGEPNPTALYDLGQSIAHLTIQAMEEGLYVHQMGGFDADEIRDNFDVPDGYKVVTLVAVGYLGKPDTLHPNLKPMEISPRERRKAKESVFSGKFGISSNLF